MIASMCRRKSAYNSDEGLQRSKSSPRVSRVSSYGRDDDRIPFDGWRCVWDPEFARDAARCLPFAQLAVTVDRAVRLISADMNGLSDPYVKVGLHGAEEEFRTKTMWRTLAPVWRERFNVDVYQPLSVLTLKVFDEDPEWKVLNMDDDYLGWVDINIGALPFNAWIGGWFDLHHPTSRAASAGQIHVQLRLACEDPSNEIYAACLPMHDIPCHRRRETIDLGDLFLQAVNLYEKVMFWWLKICEWAEHMLSYTTPPLLWILGLFLIWRPSFVLPALIFLFGLASVMIITDDRVYKYITRARDESQSSTIADDEVQLPSPVVADDNFAKRPKTSFSEILSNAMQRTKSFASLSKAWPLVQDGACVGDAYLARTNNGFATCHQPLLQTADASGGVPSIEEGFERDEEEGLETAQGEDEDHDESLKSFAKTLRTFQKTGMSLGMKQKEMQDLQAQLESFQASLQSALSLFDTVEVMMLQTYARRGLKFFCVVYAIVVAFLNDWQALLIQIVGTVYVTMLLWEYSPMGRFVEGYKRFQRRQSRLRFNGRRHSTVGEESQSELVVPGGSKNRRVRELSKKRTDALLSRSGSSEMENGDLDVSRSTLHYRAHDFVSKNFTRLTWCNDCGGLLWGVYGQGLCCQVCQRTVCKTCALCTPNDCPISKLDALPPPAEGSAFTKQDPPSPKALDQNSQSVPHKLLSDSLQVPPSSEAPASATLAQSMMFGVSFDSCLRCEKGRCNVGGNRETIVAGGRYTR